MQRCTLADYPGEIACTVFTQSCNWRCPYCHNGSLIGPVAANTIEVDAVLDFLHPRVGRIDAVVITGGEPTLQKGLADFCVALKQMKLKVKLDTNGTAPAIVSYLIAEGLADYVAMDIKQPRHRYHEAAGCPVDLHALDTSIQLLREAKIDTEFRTTVIPALHEAEDISAIARWAAGVKPLYLQPFQPKQALSMKLRQSPAPTETFLRECQALALPYLPTHLR